MKIASLGFSLVELMITVAIVAIVLTVGVPSFQEMIRNNRLATATNEMVAALNLARSEAVKRGGGINGKMRVTLWKTGTEWENGWEMFTDYPTPINCMANCSYGAKGNLDVDNNGTVDEETRLGRLLATLKIFSNKISILCK